MTFHPSLSSQRTKFIRYKYLLNCLDKRFIIYQFSTYIHNTIFFYRIFILKQEQTTLFLEFNVLLHIYHVLCKDIDLNI